MKPSFIIYIFLLFLLFNKNPYFSLHITTKQTLFSAVINSVLFTTCLYLLLQYVEPIFESMIIFNEGNINNDLVKSLHEKENNDWVLIPPPIEEAHVKPPRSFPTLPIQCAADYGNNIACCGQPPAVIPYENTCKAETPYCSGYIANEKWGTCQVDKPEIPKQPKLVSPPPEKPKEIINISPPPKEVNPDIYTIREVSELIKGNEPSIIGRFGQYILWNAHDKTKNLSQEKSKIDNAGYLLMSSDMVPSDGKSMFDTYNIVDIQTIANNYTKNKMPPYQNTGPNVVFFPSENKYSNTYESNSITNYRNQNLFKDYGDETELTGYNKFMVLIDPKISY